MKKLWKMTLTDMSTDYHVMNECIIIVGMQKIIYFTIETKIKILKSNTNSVYGLLWVFANVKGHNNNTSNSRQWVSVRKIHTVNDFSSDCLAATSSCLLNHCQNYVCKWNDKRRTIFSLDVSHRKLKTKSVCVHIQ